MSDEVSKECGFPGCGRRTRTMGLCQTHYKQQLRGEELKPIALKRPKRKGTMRYAGLSLTEHCVRMIKARAEQHGLAENTLITDILENWARKNSKLE